MTPRIAIVALIPPDEMLDLGEGFLDGIEVW